MKKRWKWMGLIVVFVMSFYLQAVSSPASAESKVMTAGSFVTMLEKAIGQSDSVLRAQYPANQRLTRTTAAILANQADTMLYEKKYENEIYAQVKQKKRIIGLGDLSVDEITAVRKCFSKGIMTGDSRGKCTQSRAWNGSKAVDRAEAEQIVERVVKPSKRIKLSPDGQVIRTTKLPANYKKYQYILESFPNAFYEKKFKYQLKTYSYKPKNLQDYAAPIDVRKMTWEIPFWNMTYKTKDILDKNLDNWCKKVELNLNKRLNFDYRTVDNRWVSDLRSTYFIFDDAKQDKRQTDKIKEYVKIAKKNKVVIRSADIRVEPSSLYFDLGEGYFLRCYAKFKVDAIRIPEAKSLIQKQVIYGDHTYLIGLQNGKWYEGYFDISLDTSNATDTGEDYSVTVDRLIKE